LPGVAVSTDIIVGFPGETEEDFAAGLDFVEKMNFSRMHVFPYSKRAGTPAAARKDQIPEPVKKERVHRMQALAEKKSGEFYRSFLGKTMRVLFETNDNGITDGLTDNYIRVYTEDEVRCGEIYQVELLEEYRDGVSGRVVS
jgi:threonylcarbamoyladenosine tRNA methylthiotransferase MtaB